MQKFDYRSPRYTVDLPVRYTLEKASEKATLPGRCIELSKDGMTLETQQPLPKDALGTVSISYQDRTLELNVRVVHAGESQSGMEFIYHSDAERKAVIHLVASLTT